MDIITPDGKNTAAAIVYMNDALDQTTINRKTVLASRSALWSELSPISMISTLPVYGSDEYYNMYGEILESARLANINVMLYDEQDIPTGYAAGKLASTYKDAVSEKLVLTEYKLEQGKIFSFDTELYPIQGKLMAAIAMNENDGTLISLMDVEKDTSFNIEAPKDSGNWKILIFTCVNETENKSSLRTILNFMSTDAASKYIGITYNKTYNIYKEYFGNVIDKALFSDIGFYYIDSCKAWTSEFNKLYYDYYGESPELLYPALWYDIGENTAYARNRLFSFRAKLLSEGFPKVFHDWAHQKGLTTVGSSSFFQSLVPTGINGDFIKFYKYIDIPVIKDVNYRGYADKFYKLLSSVAVNYGKRLAAANIFEDYPSVDKDTLFESTMNAYVRGINYIILNGISYTNESGSVNLSIDNTSVAPYLAVYNEYVSRLNSVMQGGTQKADIAVLYPIESLNAYYKLSVTPGSSIAVSRDSVPFADYIDIGYWLSEGINTDYIYLHPEVFLENCEVRGKSIVLKTEAGETEFKVLILPGSTVVSINVLNKLKEFYNNGGTVISTYQLPTFSAEKNGNNEAVSLINNIFGIYPDGTLLSDGTRSTLTKGHIYTNINASGGRAYFICSYEYSSENYKNSILLKSVIDEVITVKDVDVNLDLPLVGGSIMYTHKVNNDSNIYLLANTSDEDYNGWITIRGSIVPRVINPYTGAITTPKYASAKLSGTAITKLKISIKAGYCLIIVEDSYFYEKVSKVPLLLSEGGTELFTGKWKNIDLTDVSEENNVDISYDGVTKVISMGDDLVFFNTDDKWTNYTFSATVSLNYSSFDNTYSSCGLIFRMEDQNNYYQLNLDGNTAYLYSITDGKSSIIINDDERLESGIYYRIRVCVSENNVKVYVGNDLLYNIQDSMHQSGTIGFKTTGASTLNDIIVLGEIEYYESFWGNNVYYVSVFGLILLTWFFRKHVPVKKTKKEMLL